MQECQTFTPGCVEALKCLVCLPHRFERGFYLATHPVAFILLPALISWKFLIHHFWVSHQKIAQADIRSKKKKL